MTREPATPHPRPQLTRREWEDLSGRWQFAYDDARLGLQQRWQERDDVFEATIVVPFPPESPASGIGDRNYHPVLWYRRTFRSRCAPGNRILLQFGAVDYRAHVWVNGCLVAYHEGGHTPFTADVTEAACFLDNVVVVRVEDEPEDFEQPRGKQDWEEQAHAIWYHRTSGIWEPVWLEIVPATRIAELRWTPDVDLAQTRLDVRVERDDERPLWVGVTMTRDGEVLADDIVAVTGKRASRAIQLRPTDVTLRQTAALWSPETPNLLEARITLHDADGVIDEVGSYTAMRSISTSQNRVLLNGRPYFLRLVLEQGYWPESHLAAPDSDALRREVELIRQLGFNGVRLHQKIADPRFLYWCDRVGLLVWAEMPAAYEFSPRAVERLTREWIEVLSRDYSHPCVIAWVPINESWGVPALETSSAQRNCVRALYHLTKALDPTRLVIGNDGWEQIVTDVLTVHDYSTCATTLRQRYGDDDAVEETFRRAQPGYRSLLLPGMQRGGQPVMVTEFGGVTYDTDADDCWHGYAAVTNSEELLERYRSLVDALIDSAAVAGFCYTQLTDTVQEKNGLLTENREPKLDPAEVRRITRRVAAAVPADAIASFEHAGGHAAILVEPPNVTATLLDEQQTAGVEQLVPSALTASRRYSSRVVPGVPASSEVVAVEADRASAHH
jgi:beta-galactosidase/beta-glucuronidase